MNQDELEHLRTELWRRPLLPDQRDKLEAWLRVHPEDRESWALEEALTRALKQLPDRPVPKRVFEGIWKALDGEPEPIPMLWKRWLGPVFGLGGWRRAAVVAVAVLGLLALWRAVTPGPAALDPKVMQILQAIDAPPEVWMDFDAVARLPTAAGPDVELLTLLQ
ncbi:MAG: hypothetical protein RMN51_10705 [Verrucomicrobiota bacterium]|nr:hypothetical protein [Limisphaera sp.]MDW8382557.1 hypothetical protein [Verrucomicrobiota bacterium]